MAFIDTRYHNTTHSPKPPEPKYTAPYLIVEWPDRSPILFQREADGTYMCYDFSGTGDSYLDEWDISNATIKEVH